MESLVLKSTDITPYVNFDPTMGHLELSGRSLPEDSFSFYGPLMDWINNYMKESPHKLTVEFKLEYFNTSSSFFILNFIKAISTLKTKGSDVEIKWYYKSEDEDLRDSGRDFARLANIDFVLIAL